MAGPAASPERLVAELAEAVAFDGAWIGGDARLVAPGVIDAARAVTHVSLEPTGREQLACVVAGSPGVSVASARRPLPYLLVLDAPGQADSAARAAAQLGDAIPALCVRDDLGDRGPRLLAPLERVLAAPTLPGSWRGVGAEPAGDGEPELAALWRLAIEDRCALRAVGDEVARAEAELARARRALERASADAARRQAVHAHELARLESMLAQERAWVAEQAERIAGSTAWRLGHGATRLAWRLRGRRVRGADLPAIIVGRMRRTDPR